MINTTENTQIRECPKVITNIIESIKQYFSDFSYYFEEAEKIQQKVETELFQIESKDMLIYREIPFKNFFLLVSKKASILANLLDLFLFLFQMFSFTRAELTRTKVHYFLRKQFVLALLPAFKALILDHDYTVSKLKKINMFFMVVDLIKITFVVSLFIYDLYHLLLRKNPTKDKTASSKKVNIVISFLSLYAMFFLYFFAFFIACVNSFDIFLQHLSIFNLLFLVAAKAVFEKILFKNEFSKDSNDSNRNSSNNFINKIKTIFW